MQKEFPKFAHIVKDETTTTTMILNVRRNAESEKKSFHHFFSESTFLLTFNIICTYCLILFGSFFGNIFIIIIVYKRRDLRKTMNYFIVNMAVSDLIFPLVAIPDQMTKIVTGLLDLAHQWNPRIDFWQAVLFCKLVVSFRFCSKLGVDSN